MIELPRLPPSEDTSGRPSATYKQRAGGGGELSSWFDTVARVVARLCRIGDPHSGVRR